MRRELSFIAVGRVAVALCVLFYAGFINPVAQAWCDTECPYSHSSELSPSASKNDCPHDISRSDGTNDLCCHAPDFADTHSMSHFSLDWAPVAAPSLLFVSNNRFEIFVQHLRTDDPDISLASPPPKSILYT